MSFENLGSVGTNANFSEGGGSGGGSNLYENMFSGNSNNGNLNEFIDNMMSSSQVKILTFGLSAIFSASQNILPDINSIMQTFSISSAVSGLSPPTPAKVLGINKGAGASK